MMITLSQISSIVNKFNAFNISTYMATYIKGEVYNINYHDKARKRIINIDTVNNEYIIKIGEVELNKGLNLTVSKLDQKNPLNALNISKIISFQNRFPRVYKGTDNSTLGNKFIVSKKISGMNVDYEFDSKNTVYSFDVTDRMEVVCGETPMEEHQIFTNGYYFKDFSKGIASCYNKTKNKYIDFRSFVTTKNPDINFRELPESITIDDKVYKVKYDKNFGIIKDIDSDIFYSEINTKSALSIYPVLYDPFNIWNNMLITRDEALYKLFAIAWITTNINNSTIVSIDHYMIDPIAVGEFYDEIKKLKKK